MEYYIDAHCHVLQYSNENRFIFMQRCWKKNVKCICICATRESEWKLVPAYLAQLEMWRLEHELPQVVLCFGLHPWYANEFDTMDKMLGKLKYWLLQYPESKIGEIGLCKSVRGQSVPLEMQLKVFKAQVELAVKWNRPIVIHCVRYYDLVGDVLCKSDSTIRILFHSFHGNTQFVQRMTKHCTSVYSFSCKQLSRRILSKTFLNMLCNLPVHAIAIETDACDENAMDQPLVCCTFGQLKNILPALHAKQCFDTTASFFHI